jgi:multiple sugar transport system substrate-binding protein
MDVEKPNGVLSGGQITRREIIKKGLIGAAGLTVLPTVIAACSSSATPAPTAAPTPPPAATPTPPPAATPVPTPAGPSGNLTVGHYHSDPSDRGGQDLIDAAFTAAFPNVKLKVNGVDHNTFQDQINNYLGGTPDDAFSWFSGYRMKFFANKGLATPIDDVWAEVSSNYTAGFAKSVVGDDGKVYGVPVDYYPWAVFYRPSVWKAKGYTIPATFNDLLTLAAKMQKDGITPIAFADKDGCPAMGTFDILNLRMNGYDFHINLMSGKEKWTDPKVTAVFQTWAKLIPFYTHGYAGLKWEEACDTLVRKQSGMYLLGLFLTGEVNTADKTGAALADLDFFPFPYMGNAFDAEKALDAPIDIWMISAKSPSLQADLANAKEYLKFWSKGSTQAIMFKAAPGDIPTASDADTSSYSALQKKAVELVSAAQRITQFLDRDTRPDFAGANGMQSFLLNFLKAPSQDLAKLQASIQSFWDQLPAQ